jgi:hypothetical protein
MLINKPDSSFDLQHMFFYHSCVDHEDWHQVLQGLELVFHENSSDLETTMGIQRHDPGDACSNNLCSSRGSTFCRYKIKSSGHAN